MKLLIAGSRSITDFDLSPYIPRDTDTVISGGASGVDSLAEKYADLHKLSKYILRPRYEFYKRSAPLKRNDEMVEMADAALIIWDGSSRGSEYMLKQAKKLGKPITLIKREEGGDFVIALREGSWDI
ncbi:MAG: hypothetical protein IKL79_05915 [Clostridia bacterium]|nr:hypothetical protein [Clostridia bacterium]